MYKGNESMLTKKQKELLEYIRSYQTKSGVTPSFEEMKEAVNLKSKSGIHRLITSLEQRGFIKRLKHRARAMEIIEQNKSSNDSLESINIPLIGAIAAGEAIEAIENSSDFISIPTSMTSPNAKYFGLKVKGLSMIDEGIFDGDIAVIRKTNNVENGKIAAVLTQDNEVTLKTIKFNNDKVVLIPANQSFQSKEYKTGEIQVQGTLSGIIRKYI